MHLAAPGLQIVSTYPAPDMYATDSGTSMATPIVAGATALALAAAGGKDVIAPVELADLVLQATDAVAALLGKVLTGVSFAPCCAVLRCQGAPVCCHWSAPNRVRRPCHAARPGKPAARNTQGRLNASKLVQLAVAYVSSSSSTCPAASSSTASGLHAGQWPHAVSH